MTLIVISVREDTLPEHTKEEFEEWVKYEVGHSASMSIDNPMSDMDLDAYVREIG